jgi:hypothetical protein
VILHILLGEYLRFRGTYCHAEDGGSMFPWNGGIGVENYAVSQWVQSKSQNLYSLITFKDCENGCTFSFVIFVTNSVTLSIYGSIALSELLPLFQFLNLYTVGRAPWTGDQLVARPLPTYKTTQTQNKRTQTSSPRVGFELTIPVFERATPVHALDRAATVIGYSVTLHNDIRFFLSATIEHSRNVHSHR